MTITDKKVIKWINAIGDEILREDIEEYPDNERDGRTDIEFFADELSYFLSLFDEDEHQWNYDLTKAKKILRDTRCGRIIPIDMLTLRPVYREIEIEDAKKLVSMHRKMKYRYKKLVESGCCGQWY